MASSASDRSPRIGVTTYLEPARWGVWDRPAALIRQSYLDAVVRVEATPILLPPVAMDVDSIVDVLDGVVLAGGADLDPTAYGEPPHPTTLETRPDRDSFEVALARQAMARDLPVLGVCRGAQILNVALGGTLHQHLPDKVGHEEHQPVPGRFGTSRVRLAAGSRVGQILGDRCHVSCHHHQAVERLGAGLTAVAWAADGTVEAVELSDREFVVGLQWHPEEDDTGLPLFGALAGAAGVARGSARSVLP